MATPQQRQIALKIAEKAARSFEAGFAELAALAALGDAPDLVERLHEQLAAYNPNIRPEGN